MLGNGLMALGAAGFALLPPGDAGPLAFALRAVQGLSWALVFSSAGMMAMKLAPAGRLGETIALHSSANMLTNAARSRRWPSPGWRCWARYRCSWPRRRSRCWGPGSPPD